jgi:4-amino-4-deoxy-L-arabinose transferase-like glycosyltransferase
MSTPAEPDPTLEYASPQTTRLRPPVAVAPLLRPTGRHLWILLAITLLGGILRFSLPTHPLLWGDDAYTVYRTHAEYQAMLDILQYDGFTPLHYELYWLLGRITGTEDSPMTPGGPNIVHAVHLTPAVVRFLPALWGSLMVPAMYLLAVHLVRRRTALVVALVTACSAYLLGYSRDMKMYMMVWCFSAFSAGTLLWWFRTGSRIAWLSWVAASLAMASSHMTGMALLPFEAVFFLTRSNVRWKQSILFLIGLAIIIIPPAGYITQFNRWAQQEVEDFGFEVEGLTWVVSYNAGRTGPDLIRYATSAYLTSWEWPKESEESAIPPWILTSLKAATALILLLAAIGLMPWSKRLRGISPDEHVPQPWWRTALWLGMWVIVPTYFMYCRSVSDFASPRDWWEWYGAMLAGNGWYDKDGTISGKFWICLGLAAVAVGALLCTILRVRRALVAFVPLVAAGALIVALLRTGVPRTSPEGAAWVQVIAKPLLVWADWMTEPLVLTGLAVLLPGLILYYCAPSWRGRLSRFAQFALVTAALIGCCWMVNRIAQDKLNKEVVQYLSRGSAKTLTIADFSASQIENAKLALTRPNAAWQSIFMPRYIGFVWIGICISLCALLMRLPTRAFRCVAVLLVVGINLAQFGGRLFAGTEPPLDRVARDIWAHDSHNAAADQTTRVYVNDSQLGPGHPGYGTMNGQQGKYYLGLERGYWIHPSEWKNVSVGRYFDVGGSGRGGRGGGGGVNISAIGSEARRSGVKRIIVWEKYFNQKPPTNDPILPLLGPGWSKPQPDEDYTVRIHWTWAELYIYRRSEYVRK